jgi:molybdopterin/thiamine biosynthesis adenylyltransferase/rhodanese-related sulfurtransferase
MKTENTLTHEEIRRYSRHLIMPQVGMAGQRQLKAASVLIVGLGGLGSPQAMYLAAAGVGRLGLVDDDTVALSNLQRQVIHGTGNVGRAKLESAAERLRDLNPNIQIDTYPVRLGSANALDVLAPYDIIVDGTDNFPTRYLLNDACVLLGKPNVYGSVFRFDGQATVFDARGGPCYRCLFPQPPPPGLMPGCAEGGVLGVMPGVIGTIQATEAIKLILGIGETLVGRLLLYDALAMTFDFVKLRKNSNCPVCGEHPTITELIDYEQFCGVPAHDTLEAAAIAAVPAITPLALKRRLDSGEDVIVLDVREPVEWDIADIPQATHHIPRGEILERLVELDAARTIVVYCRMGYRSAEVVQSLREHGFTRAVNLAGGINAWAREVDPRIPEY